MYDNLFVHNYLTLFITINVLKSTEYCYGKCTKLQLSLHITIANEKNMKIFFVLCGPDFKMCDAGAF